MRSDPTTNPFRILTQPSPPLTTVIAVKCMDGVAVACDSQGTYERAGTKTLTVNKISPIGDVNHQRQMLVAGSGDSGHINLLVEALDKAMKGKIFKDEQLRNAVSKVLLSLHKKHNVERSRTLGLKEIEMFYHPDAILAAKLADPLQPFGLYHLRPDGWVDVVPKYQVLGTGGTFASFMLDMFERQIPVLAKEGNWSNANIEAMQVVLPVVVSQVKYHDVYSGGRTKVAVVDKDGFREVSSSEISVVYNKVFDEIEHKMKAPPEMLRMLKSVLGDWGT